jgi:xylose isomerase
MDAFARGLKTAYAIQQDGKLAEFIQTRYSSWDSDLGRKIEAGESSLEEIEAYAMQHGEPVISSGRQEMLENLINQYI